MLDIPQALRGSLMQWQGAGPCEQQINPQKLRSEILPQEVHHFSMFSSVFVAIINMLRHVLVLLSIMKYGKPLLAINSPSMSHSP